MRAGPTQRAGRAATSARKMFFSQCSCDAIGAERDHASKWDCTCGQIRDVLRDDYLVKPSVSARLSLAWEGAVTRKHPLISHPSFARLTASPRRGKPLCRPPPFQPSPFRDKKLTTGTVPMVSQSVYAVILRASPPPSPPAFPAGRSLEAAAFPTADTIG